MNSILVILTQWLYYPNTIWSPPTVEAEEVAVVDLIVVQVLVRTVLMLLLTMHGSYNIHHT